MSATLTVIVNGRARRVPEGASVAALLDDLGVAPGAVAVERNGTVLTRAQVTTVALADGDQLELIRAVAGG